MPKQTFSAFEHVRNANILTVLKTNRLHWQGCAPSTFGKLNPQAEKAGTAVQKRGSSMRTLLITVKNDVCKVFPNAKVEATKTTDGTNLFGMRRARLQICDAIGMSLLRI